MQVVNHSCTYRNHSGTYFNRKGHSIYEGIIVEAGAHLAKKEGVGPDSILFLCVFCAEHGCR